MTDPTNVTALEEFVIRTLADGPHPGPSRDLYEALALCGEAGEVAELVKKANRPKHPVPLDRVELAMELSDVLAYVIRNAKTHGMTIEDVLRVGNAKATCRRACGKNPDLEHVEAARVLGEPSR